MPHGLYDPRFTPFANGLHLGLVLSAALVAGSVAWNIAEHLHHVLRGH